MIQASTKIAKKTEKGFTLIEMLFYTLFITLIVGSALGIVHQILRNSENIKSGISVEEEGNFMLRKIAWALNDSVVVNPLPDSADAQLTVVKNGGAGTVRIRSGGGVVQIDSGGSYKQLSNDRFTVTGLRFERQGSDLILANIEIGSRSFQLTRKLR